MMKIKKKTDFRNMHHPLTVIVKWNFYLATLFVSIRIIASLSILSMKHPEQKLLQAQLGSAQKHSRHQQVLNYTADFQSWISKKKLRQLIFDSTSKYFFLNPQTLTAIIFCSLWNRGTLYTSFQSPR